MPAPVELIQTFTVGSAGQQIIDFANIPQTYSDICILASTRNSSSGSEVYVTVNGSGGSGTAISNMYLISNSSSIYAAAANSAAAIWQTVFQTTAQAAGIFSNMQIYCPNYKSTTNKIFMVESIAEDTTQTGAQQRLMASALATSSPVTSMQLIAANGVFQQYSTFSLYGINK